MNDVPSPRLVAAFLVGLVVGMAAIAPFAGHEADRLRVELHERELELGELGVEVAHLKEELREGGHPIPSVRTAQVTVTGVDRVTALLLAKDAERFLGPLLGRPVDSVDARLLQSLLDRRLLQAEDRFYRLRVRLAVVAPVTEVELVATPVEP